MAIITAWIECQGERGFKWSGEKPYRGDVITFPDGRQGVVLRIKDELWFYARRDGENRLGFYPMELWVKPTMKYTPLENLSWEAVYLPRFEKFCSASPSKKVFRSSEIVCPALKSTVLGIFPTNVR